MATARSVVVSGDGLASVELKDARVSMTASMTDDRPAEPYSIQAFSLAATVLKL